jgi:hypothetical protein
MANVPTIVVGTGNQQKVVTPALLTGLDSTGAIVALQVDASGNLLTSRTQPINASYLSTTTTGNYNPAAPNSSGMVIYHVASTNALITSMVLQLHGPTSAIDFVPVGSDISFTSRYGVTGLTVTYSVAYTYLGTPVSTLAAGSTITFRKVSDFVLARLT